MRNHAYIRQLVQKLIKWYFQASVGHTCCLLIINQGLTNSVRSLPQVCHFILVYAKKFWNPCIYVHFSSIAYCSLSAEYACFPLLFATHYNILFCGMFFTVEKEKVVILSWIRLGVTVYPRRGGYKTLPSILDVECDPE